MTIGHLIIDFGDRTVGDSVFAGCLEALDDSLGLEVLALLAKGRRTELSRREVVAPGVVGGFSSCTYIEEQVRKVQWPLHIWKVESMGPPHPEMGNR